MSLVNILQLLCIRFFLCTRVITVAFHTIVTGMKWNWKEH